MSENFTAGGVSGSELDHTPPDIAEITVTARISGLMNEETYELAQYVMGRAMYVLQAVGLVCNALNVLVMTRPSMRSPATRYLAAMSAVQLVYILLDIVISIIESGMFPSAGFFSMAYRVYAGIYVMPCLSRLHYVLTCLVTTERLLAVMVPLKAKNFSVVRHPVIFIVIAPFVVFAAHIPSAVKYEVYEAAVGTSTYYTIRYTDIYLLAFDVLNVISIVNKVCFVYMELLFLVGANTALIAALARHSATRRSLTMTMENDAAARRRETQLTVTILVSTVVFVLLNLPTVTNSLVAEFIPDRYGHFSSQRLLFTFIMSLGAVCYALAISTDFFAYICLSSAYRTTLIHLLSRVWPGKTPSLEKSISDMSKTTKTQISEKSVSE